MAGVIVVALITSSAIACASFGTTPSDDAGTNDAGTNDADAPAGIIVYQQTFEGATATECGDAVYFAGSGAASSPGRGSAQGCRVCRSEPGPGVFTLDGILVRLVTAGERYIGEAWVRASSTGNPAPFIILNFRLRAEATPAPIASRKGATVYLDATWQRVFVEWTLPNSADELNMYGESTGAKDTCFEIDDVIIRRLD